MNNIKVVISFLILTSAFTWGVNSKQARSEGEGIDDPDALVMTSGSYENYFYFPTTADVTASTYVHPHQCPGEYDMAWAHLGYKAGGIGPVQDVIAYQQRYSTNGYYSSPWVVIEFTSTDHVIMRAGTEHVGPGPYNVNVDTYAFSRISW